MAEERKAAQTLRLDRRSAEAVRHSVAVLEQCGYRDLALGVQKVLQDVSRDRFTVAVVGEFSRGKSTFLNRLLEVEALPVGNMPTTAMLTKVRYAPKPVLIHFDEKGVKRGTYPLATSSWDGLVADNFGGQDPKGIVFAGVDQPWLARLNLELMDTPGAGDLEASRARLIGDALLSADGALITVSATQAMSLSEKLFIEQRLIARKTPFMLLLLTKLDQIPESQRGQMIEFVKSKLVQWGMDIPVFIPGDVAVPEQYASITGMDKVKGQIESWVNDPKRTELTQKWLLARLDALIGTAVDSAAEERRLASVDGQKREELLRNKQMVLDKAQVQWEELLVQMRGRSARASEQVMKRVAKYQQTITERLQYEASHTSQPERWWREDLPYRLKVELTNMASSVDNQLSRTIAEDVRWFNAALERCFKTSVGMPTEAMAELGELGPMEISHAAGLKDLDKQRSFARVASSAVSILGAVSLSCLGLGFLSVVATMGVGTGASLVTERVFKGKIEQQRIALKDTIGQEVPGIVRNAARDSQAKVRGVYAEIIRAAQEKQEIWMRTQQAALEKSADASGQGDVQLAEKKLRQLMALRQSIA